SYSLVGPHAQQALEGLTADKLFLGVDGLDPDVGITTPDPLEAELNALMLRVARETIAVADASKLGRRSLSVIAPAPALHRLVTDGGADPGKAAALRAQGVEVIIV
ncbi:MAG TPA: DeoR/GlpR transcriptional regulator, partial [Lysobacter sp.]|nr:DeoR/GlpR transcriptional regulator [Lysobacter sp.]